MNKCYYDEPRCDGDLWQCLTCKEWYCAYHWHVTDLGVCVECVACERARLEQEDPPIGAIDDMLDEPDTEAHSDWVVGVGGWVL